MGDTPVVLNKVGRRGTKTLFTIMVTICTVIVAILTAYFTAEASQDARIVKIDGRVEAVDDILGKLDETLTEQSKLVRDNSGRLIEVQTTQKMMRDQLKEISADVKKLGEK